MKTFRITGLVCLVALACAVHAQRAEYWIDADPGFGHGIDIVIVSESGNATIATSSLQPGVHTIGVRAKQGNTWGQTYTHRFYVLKTMTTAISGAEYWVDADPGCGKATAVAADADTQQLLIPFSTEELTTGIHTLGVRMRQGDVWGQTYTHRFFVLTTMTTAISGAEWWLDSDPGCGKATAVAADADTQQLLIPFSTEELTTGIHTLGVRMRQGDVWGQTYTHRFFVLTTMTTTISGAEWWLDADPGCGKATAVAAGAETTELTIPFLTDTLKEGIHTLGVRMRQGDVWGQTYTHRFFVLTTMTTTISGAEWWLDADPGCGKATAVAAGEGTTELTIPFRTDTLKQGVHTLGVRMCQGDVWGHTYTHRFFAMPDRSTPMTIEAVEACWDYDAEHAISIPFSQVADSAVITNQVFDTDQLELGTHILCICVKADGKWSILSVFEVTKSEATGLDGVAEQVVTYKILRNDQVLIIRDGDTYTLQGLKIKD